MLKNNLHVHKIIVKGMFKPLKGGGGGGWLSLDMQPFQNTAKLLPIKMHIFRQKYFYFASTWSEIMSLKSEW